MLSQFLCAWLLIAVFGVLYRPRMIWKEESKSYRTMLFALTLPLFVVSGLVMALIHVARVQWHFAKATIEGENPE